MENYLRTTELIFRVSQTTRNYELVERHYLLLVGILHEGGALGKSAPKSKFTQKYPDSNGVPQGP